MVLIIENHNDLPWEGWVFRIWLIIPRRTKLSQISFVTKVGVIYWTRCDNIRIYVGIIIRIDRKHNRKYWYLKISHTYGKIRRLSCGFEWIDLKWYDIRLCSWLYSCERRSKIRVFILEVRSKQLTKTD